VDSGSIAASKMGATQAMLESLDRLVYTELGSRCRRLGKLKERTDPMLAIYPGGGARFQKHVDNTAKDGRRLTVLCYLNESWDAKADGGALRMHETKFVEQNKKKGGQQSAKEVGVAREVDPLGGRIALFWSDAIPHEVLPAHAHRHAVTIWSAIYLGLSPLLLRIRRHHLIKTLSSCSQSRRPFTFFQSPSPFLNSNSQSSSLFF